jgi:hypothetical protein
MMVCPYDDSRLLLILQTDHSRIAGWLAAHWGNDRFAQLRPYASMVLAAQEHDSGWWDWEIKPSVNEQGYPADYIGSIKHLGQGVWLDLYRRAIERLATRDAYAAYFVSMHGEALLTQGMGLLPSMPDYRSDSAVQNFIAEQKAPRARWLAQLRTDPASAPWTEESHLWTNFKLIEVFDQFAQFVCNRYPFNSQARKNGPTNKLSNVPVPVADGAPDATLTIEVQNESEAIVWPYPSIFHLCLSPSKDGFCPIRSYTRQDDFLEDFYSVERIGIRYALRAE